MSSANNYSGTLVIYQSGLGGTQYDFYKTIEKLVGSNPYRHKAFVVSDNLENSYLNAGVTWQDADGYWSHKPGTTPVRRYDHPSTNNLILDPQLAYRGNYTSFIGYFVVSPWGNMYE